MKVRMASLTLVLLIPLAALSSDRDKDAVWLNKLGQAAYKDGRHQEALSYFEKAVETSRRVNDIEGIYSNLGNIGALYHKLGQNEKALSYYEEALTIGRQHPSSKHNIAAILVNAGEVYNSLGEDARSIPYFEEALKMFRELDAPETLGMLNPKDPSVIASVLESLGLAYGQLGQLKQAVAYLEECVKIRRGLYNPLQTASALNVLGITYAVNNQAEKAFPYLEESLKIARQEGKSQPLAAALSGMGSAYAVLGQDEKAVSYFEEAIKILKSTDDQIDLAVLLRNIGQSYSLIGRYSKTRYYLEEALKIRRELKSQTHVAAIVMKLGSVYANLGQYEKALASFEESLSLSKELDKPGYVAKNLNNIGSVYYSLGHYEKALSHFQEAFKLWEKLGNDESIVETCDLIGSVYYAQGQIQMATIYYENPMDVRRRQWNTTKKTGWVEWLNLIATLELSQKHYAIAEEMLRQAEKEKAQKGDGSPPNAVLVELLLATGRYDEALDLLKTGQINWDTADPARIQFRTQNGICLKGKGMLKEASHEFLEAVSVSEGIRQRVKEKAGFFVAGGYGGRIRPYRALVATLTERALKPYLSKSIYLAAGILIIGFILAIAKRRLAGATLMACAIALGLAIVIPYLSRPRDANETGPPYEEDKKFSAYGKDLASNAFYFSEATKARTLLEAMSDSARKRNSAGLPVDIKDEEEDLVNQMAALDDKWAETYEKGEEDLKRLVERKQRLKAQLESVTATIRKQFPKYAALNYPGPIPPEELPLKDKEILLEYAISDDASYVFKVSRDGVEKILRLPIAKEELDGLVNEFVLPLQSPDTKEEFSTALGQRLYDLLLKKALTGIPAEYNVIIVPDGILGLLPFEALVIETGSDLSNAVFVGDTWKTSYYQSATVLALTRLLKPSEASKPFFGLGNPVYATTDPRYIAYKQGAIDPILIAGDPGQYAFRGLATRSEFGKTYKNDDKGKELVYLPLSETEDEVKTIAKLFEVKPDPPDVLFGVSANETDFRKTPLKDYRRIHLATHADLPGKVQGINEPFLLLGQVENEGGDDGFLTVTEVLDLALDADLVVLSACVTGRGKAMEGEGVVNFARAFQHAGARSIVVSLWEVASNETVEYMQLFYHHLKEGKSKGEAMSLARIEIKARYPNPFFWAPFILHGEA